MRSLKGCCLLLLVLSGCAAEPVRGPDKQFAGTLSGAMTGAGAGAVTGFQLGAGTGPGAAVGAGLGAVAGGIQGLVQDQLEEQSIETAEGLTAARETARAHEILEDHFKRRMELHPTRDIFPAELFFGADNAELLCSAKPLVRELAKLNKERFPWSRLVIAAYVKAADDNSDFARYLAERRARVLGNAFIGAGIEPRRIKTRAVIMNEPILIDPADRSDRYNQAVELIHLDR